MSLLAAEMPGWPHSSPDVPGKHQHLRGSACLAHWQARWVSSSSCSGSGRGPLPHPLASLLSGLGLVLVLHPTVALSQHGAKHLMHWQLTHKQAAGWAHPRPLQPDDDGRVAVGCRTSTSTSASRGPMQRWLSWRGCRRAACWGLPAC